MNEGWRELLKKSVVRWMANRTTLRSAVVDTGIMGKSK